MKEVDSPARAPRFVDQCDRRASFDSGTDEVGTLSRLLGDLAADEVSGEPVGLFVVELKRHRIELDAALEPHADVGRVNGRHRADTRRCCSETVAASRNLGRSQAARATDLQEMKVTLATEVLCFTRRAG